MNSKLAPYIKNEGYCCLWAWLETNRRALTSVLMKELEGVIAVRALRYQRKDHRRGLTVCTKCAGCLKQRIETTRKNL